MRSKQQIFARALSRMNETDRKLTKAIHGWRKKQTGGFSVSELSCLVLAGLAGQKGPQNDADVKVKAKKREA